MPGAVLLEVHGQADDRGLFDIATHRGLLDAFGGLNGCCARRRAHLPHCDAARATRWPSCKAAAAAAAADADFVRACRQGIVATSRRRRARRARLAGERALMMNAARIAEDVSAAPELLAGERGAKRRSGAGAEEAVAHERRGAQGGGRRRSGAGTGLCPAPKRRGASWMRCCRGWTPTPGRWKEGRAAVRAARPGAQIWRDAGCAAGACCDDFDAKREALDASGGRMKEAEAAVAATRERLSRRRRANCRKRATARRASWKRRWPANWRR